MQKHSNEFTIGKLAGQADVSVETVRFYQRSGLLEVPEPKGKVRYYHSQHVRRLRFIKKAQLAGFTLKEISQLLDFDARSDRAQALALARGRLAQIDQQLDTLMAARSALTRLALVCENSEHGPCPIIEAFEGNAPTTD